MKKLLLAEGNTEKNVLAWLIDNDRLIYSYEELFSEKIFLFSDVHKKRVSSLFQGYNISLIDEVVAVTDRESTPKISILKNATRTIYINKTEIEEILIVHLDEYNKYKNSHIKPSDYLKQNHKIDKNFNNWLSIFNNDIDLLVGACRKYQGYKSDNTISKLIK